VPQVVALPERKQTTDQSLAGGIFLGASSTFGLGRTSAFGLQPFGPHSTFFFGSQFGLTGLQQPSAHGQLPQQLQWSHAGALQQSAGHTQATRPCM